MACFYVSDVKMGVSPWMSPHEKTIKIKETNSSLHEEEAQYIYISSQTTDIYDLGIQKRVEYYS